MGRGGVQNAGYFPGRCGVAVAGPGAGFTKQNANSEKARKRKKKEEQRGGKRGWVAQAVGSSNPPLPLPQQPQAHSIVAWLAARRRRADEAWVVLWWVMGGAERRLPAF